MRVVIGADHAGFTLKQYLIEVVTELGHEVVDVGTHESARPVDYPDYAILAAAELLAGRAERGILVCGSGVGVSVAANKIKGIRAGLTHDHYSARQGVEHDDMNVIVIGARVIGENNAADLVQGFLSARFSNEERHVRRLNKVKAIEAGEVKPQ